MLIGVFLFGATALLKLGFTFSWRALNGLGDEFAATIADVSHFRNLLNFGGRALHTTRRYNHGGRCREHSYGKGKQKCDQSAVLAK